jgi:hypothetical protein
MSEIIDVNKLDLSKLDLSIPGRTQTPEVAEILPLPEAPVVENTGNRPTFEPPPEPQVPTPDVSEIMEKLKDSERPSSPKTEKVVKSTKWIFWLIAAGVAALVGAQFIFKVPHPKNWHLSFLGPTRGSIETIFVPEPAKKVRPKVIETGRFLIAIQFPDGTIEKRTGGSHSWRLNNPGRLSYNKFTISHGAFGSDKRYAIFSSYDEGRKANSFMLFDDPEQGYKDLSIADAIKKYTEGNSGASEYTKLITKALKLPQATKLSTMTPEEKKIFLDQIEIIEQFVPGRIWKYKNLEEYKRLG